MKDNNEYWERAALLREIAVQDGATLTAKDILRLYDEALDDIKHEIDVIYTNFKKRFGLDDETAAYFLTQAQQEENMKSLVQALQYAPDEKARRNMLKYIHRDGLSVRAYAARTERYKAVETVIYAKMKTLAAKEISMLDDMLKNAYKESYYGNIDDAAKGLDVGISFAILDDKAIEEAVGARWHGKRFSERVWTNTDRLAKQTQELVTKALMSGESLTKTSRKLGDIFDASKYRTTTLVHTETAHIHAVADMRAYEELGIAEYRYLATLDHMTCETCQKWDNKVIPLSEAREGYNYPTMHPRCRCTTTINIGYGNRRARNPLTGKNEVIDGSVTYSEWKNNLSAEQKSALKLARKKDSNRTADKLQFLKYQKRLGTKVVGRSFDKWQEMKYNDKDRYHELKKWFRYEGKPYLQSQLAYTLFNGEKDFIPNKSIISSVKTIAGAGSKTELRIEQKLVNDFGGDLGEWCKRVGKIESAKYIFDVHWYELNGIQYRMKLKNRSDKK